MKMPNTGEILGLGDEGSLLSVLSWTSHTFYIIIISFITSLYYHSLAGHEPLSTQVFPFVSVLCLKREILIQ